MWGASFNDLAKKAAEMQEQAAASIVRSGLLFVDWLNVMSCYGAFGLILFSLYVSFVCFCNDICQR